MDVILGRVGKRASQVIPKLVILLITLSISMERTEMSQDEIAQPTPRHSSPSAAEKGEICKLHGRPKIKPRIDREARRIV